MGQKRRRHEMQSDSIILSRLNPTFVYICMPCPFNSRPKKFKALFVDPHPCTPVCPFCHLSGACTALRPEPPVLCKASGPLPGCPCSRQCLPFCTVPQTASAHQSVGRHLITQSCRLSPRCSDWGSPGSCCVRLDRRMPPGLRGWRTLQPKRLLHQELV